MEQWQRDRLDHHERVGYIPIYRQLAMSHTCPMYWYDESLPIGQSVLHSGTVTIVNTRTETLVVSAEHVFRQYLLDKNENPRLKCQMGGVTVEPEKYLVDTDQELDLATFVLPSVLLAATGAIAHNTQKWPPDPMMQAELAILGGYPGNRRSEREGFLDTDFVTFITRVSQASDSHMAFQLNLAESHWPAGERIGQHPDLGGMSGGPVFRMRAGPIEAIEFAGIIYQAHTEYEIVRARQVSHITDVGALKC